MRSDSTSINQAEAAKAKALRWLAVKPVQVLALPIALQLWLILAHVPWRDELQAYLLVRELGGANLASGVVGLASLAMPSFVPPAALAAGIFYAVAGIEHVRSKHRGTNETIALVSDLFIAVVLLGFAAAALLRGLR